MESWSRQRRKRTALVAGLVLLLAWAVWVSRGALFPYTLALVMAYVLLPAVNRLEAALGRVILRSNPGARRAIAILLVYVGIVLLLALFFMLAGPVLSAQFRALWDNREVITERVNDWSDEGLRWYRQNVPADLQAQAEQNVQRITGGISEALQAGLQRTVSLVTGTISFVLGFAVIPFWLFYVLYDQVRMREGVRDIVPEHHHDDFYNIIRLVDKVLGAYIRGQIVLSLAVGTMAAVGLTLLGVQYPVVLGLIAGLTESLPFIGPFLGAIPAVIVATIQEPILGLWTALLFLAIQQVENVVLVPRISGHAVELHPAIIMVVLVIGNEVAGLLGMLVAVPLTAVIRDVFRYLYLRYQEDPASPEQALERVRGWSGAPPQRAMSKTE